MRSPLREPSPANHRRYLYIAAGFVHLELRLDLPGAALYPTLSEEHSFLKFQQFKINFLMTKMKHAIRSHLDVNYVIKTIFGTST